MAIRNGASVRTKRYNSFRGVDFASDPALVDDTRSPWAPNMISDRGGMPEKRPGWRVFARWIFQTPQGNQTYKRINGLYSGVFGGEQHLLAHVGTYLYRFCVDGLWRSERIVSGIPDSRSVGVFMGDCLWIFTGSKLLRYDGEHCVNASDAAYVPLTVISCTASGGGQAYEQINLIGNRQRVGFLADGTSTVYKLPYESVDAIGDVEVNGERLDSGVTRDPENGTLVFDTAPAAPAAGAGDNIYVTFTKTLPGSSDRIDKCTTAVVWGADGASDRIVAAGNPDYPNLDFICAFADGTYWPDLGYSSVGTAETRIMGYLRLGEQLAVIKEDNGQDSSIFIRSGYVDGSGKAVFPLKPCVAGMGAVSRFGFGSIGNEQLVLTGSGVYALTSNSLTAERIMQNRSLRVDSRLTKEELSEAVTCSCRGCFLVFVNGHVYGLDGRQPKSCRAGDDTDALYECFYWDNVPARCVMKTVENGEEVLWFGTEDGRVCRFNTDIDDVTRFNDDGEAISAVWSTRLDDDGDVTVLKTLLKRGNAVEIKPCARSGAKILLRTERDTAAWMAAEETMDIFDWENIDFSRFTFAATDVPQTVPFRRKVKNYKRLQIIVKNDAVNEGFGVYGIVKHFVSGGFSKR